MKVKNFIKDVGGASRVTKARLNAFDSASPALESTDPIGDVSRAWHPGPIELVVTKITPACKTAKTIRFERTDGGKLPFFYAGQYIVLDFKIGESQSGASLCGDHGEKIQGRRLHLRLCQR